MVYLQIGRDVFFGDAAPTQQYDVNVVGGSEGINYYISFGHYDTEGLWMIPHCAVRLCAVMWK